MRTYTPRAGGTDARHTVARSCHSDPEEHVCHRQALPQATMPEQRAAAFPLRQVNKETLLLSDKQVQGKAALPEQRRERP